MSTRKVSGLKARNGQPGASPDVAPFDRKALAVGRAVLAETGAEDVILFGSRARGDYLDNSDIDLLIIHSRWQDDDVRKKARVAWDIAESFYGTRIPVDVVGFTPGEFHDIRHSINSVAAIASEEGFTMDGQPAGDIYSNDDEDYSNEWTNTGNRCYHARSHLHMLRGAIDLGAANIMIGQQAQQAMEHALKALISASGRRYEHHHNLASLERDARRFDRGFTHPLESDLATLTDYSGRLKYNEPYVPLGDRNELYRQVEGDVQHLFQRIAELTGRDPWHDQR